MVRAAAGLGSSTAAVGGSHRAAAGHPVDLVLGRAPGGPAGRFGAGVPLFRPGVSGSARQGRAGRGVVASTYRIGGRLVRQPRHGCRPLLGFCDSLQWVDVCAYCMLRLLIRRGFDVCVQVRIASPHLGERRTSSGRAYRADRLVLYGTVLADTGGVYCMDN